MFEGVEDAKDWFHTQRLERRINLIELWEGGETEELKEQTGDHYEQFQELMEQVREENAKDEVTDVVLRDELEAQGFETVVALKIQDAMDSSIGPSDDVIFLRRKLSPAELERLIELCVQLYEGEYSTNTVQEKVDSIHAKDVDGDDSELSSDLFNRANRFMQASIRNSITLTGGLAQVRAQVEDSANYDEEYLEALFGPVEANLERLQQFYIYYRIKELETEVGEVNQKLDEVNIKLNKVINRLN